MCVWNMMWLLFVLLWWLSCNDWEVVFIMSMILDVVVVGFWVCFESDEICCVVDKVFGGEI